MFGTWQALSKFKDICLTYDNNDIVEIVDKFKYLAWCCIWSTFVMDGTVNYIIYVFMYVF